MKLVLGDLPLKLLLRLFAADEPLHIQELGDTWHPSRGFVDETLVRGVERVGQLLVYDYDFAGLVHLIAAVGEVTIHYRRQQYELHGSAKALEKLDGRIRALNATYTELEIVVLFKSHA